MMRTKIVSIAAFVAAGLLVLAALTWTSRSMAYDRYSVNRDATNCRTCHGNFRTSPYTSLVDGQSWGDDLHDVHRGNMLEGDCDACHASAGEFPTFIGTSAGGTGPAAISCSGCHGRSQDGTGSGSAGYSAGLRQRHWRSAVTSCVSCHPDSNPATKVPVAENVLPPYYANPGPVGSHPAMPTDACNPSPAFNENFAASTLGLDNDGNGQFDMADAACSPATPGEVSKTAMMLVTAYNKATGDVSVSYTPACATTNNNVEYGNLASLATYTYAGQVCAVGNTGAATFGVPAGSFFLVVANNGTSEGSYGRRRTGATLAERPVDATLLACPTPLVLATRCDP
jgi:cytochrome c553